jgi:GNAT superfamily N-acetyltransferase
MLPAEAPVVAAWKRELWGDESAEPGETVLVWEEPGGAIAGFVALAVRPWADGCLTAPVPFVEGWYVAPDARRRGIGAALIRAAEEWARAQGFEELGSDALLENSVSLRAHRRLGFLPTERIQYFRKDLAAPPPAPVRIEPHDGPRAELRPLFEEAEDSTRELDAYIDAGLVLVARDDGAVVGHLQLVDGPGPAEAEVKNMAVAGSHRARGVGRALLEAAAGIARGEGRDTLAVATAAADVDNLRFYQRAGFRLRAVERDAFTPATGYAPGTLIDGIELRDRVWLDRDLRG